MKPVESWSLTVLGLLGLVLVLHHLGWNAGENLAAALRGVESFLNRPLY